VCRCMRRASPTAHPAGERDRLARRRDLGIIPLVGGIRIAFALMLLLAPVAAAGDEVQLFMERYELALDHGDVVLLSELYENWSADKADRLENYFGSVVTEFNVEFSDLEVDHLDVNRARVRFLRRDRFTDVQTSRRVEKRLRLVKNLVLRDGRWCIGTRK